VKVADLPLRDIQLPPEPAWWPPAPGWWVLGLLLLSVLVWLARRIATRLTRARRRRQRLALLTNLLAAAGDGPLSRVRAAHESLRRVALQDAPEVLSSTPEAWLDWLDRGMAGRPFSEGLGRELLSAPYRRELSEDTASALLQLTRDRLAREVP
jgi:hypothetical protein